MLRYLTADIICSEKRSNIFREYSSRKTVSFEEQRTVQRQIPEHIFALNGDCVNYPSNIFRNAHRCKKWGISLGYSSSLAGNIQSRDASRPIVRVYTNTTAAQKCSKCACICLTPSLLLLVPLTEARNVVTVRYMLRRNSI